MSRRWRSELDDAQWEAVSAEPGSIIVLAGAGSGKTRVLTHRVAYLLSEGVPPEQILALTFTNKAADTMRERLLELIGPAAKDVRMGTFHSVFARWLRQELKGSPVSASFTIYDEEDSRNLIRTLLKESGADPKRASAVRAAISRWKNAALSWRELSEPASAHERIALLLYQRYEQRMRSANALDFDDLLLETYRLLLRETSVLQKYQQNIQHILVDEYQDTNPLQYYVLRLLALPHRNLFVVGDDAQSIYAFRGADVRNFRYMEQDFAPVRIIRLEQNYRSTPQILQAANNLLTHSKELYPKNLFTYNPPGPEPVLYSSALTPREEALFVVQRIREEMARYHLHPRDIAILYRINAYSRTFEEELRAERIPYKLVGAVSFYQREEVKHFLAFIRFLVNTDDDQALLRILSVRGEGIGDTTQEKLLNLAAQEGKSLWAIWMPAASLFRGSIQRAMTSFYQGMNRLRESFYELPLHEAVENLLEESGLIAYYQNGDNARERIENLRELVKAIQEYLAKQEGEPSLRAFLDTIALVFSTGDQKEVSDAVWLSTVHGVKGLEFHTVFVVGVTEGLFPHLRATEEGQAAIEEERRIFYVALTRARRHLYLTYPLYDIRGSAPQPTTPSRFLEEIEAKAHTSFSVPESPSRPALIGVRRRSLPSPVRTPTPIPDPSPTSAIQPGCWVEHSHFGRGRVLHREENGAAGVVHVDFEDFGMKKLDLRYARLRILS
ncbi:MAG: UvrD-helicase domain-containing protein [Bacteroidia bacterium]|nr:UvrD-helicase domain-containing protein [Bacteroidia bacterium]